MIFFKLPEKKGNLGVDWGQICVFKKKKIDILPFIIPNIYNKLFFGRGGRVLFATDSSLFVSWLPCFEKSQQKIPYINRNHEYIKEINYILVKFKI